MNIVEYLKKIINNCFLKKKYNDHDYTEVIFFTSESTDDSIVETVPQ